MLPKGIWYEANKQRYRVRIQISGQILLSYHKTETEALRALEQYKGARQPVPSKSDLLHHYLHRLKISSAQPVQGTS